MGPVFKEKNSLHFVKLTHENVGAVGAVGAAASLRARLGFLARSRQVFSEYEA